MVQRDERGRIKKGSVLNPEGRAPKEREVQYMNVLVSCVSIDDWKEIITKAVTDAKRGDSVARKFLADYIIGPPIEKKEITGADGGPLEVTEIVYEMSDGK